MSTIFWIQLLKKLQDICQVQASDDPADEAFANWSHEFPVTRCFEAYDFDRFRKVDFLDDQKPSWSFWDKLSGDKSKSFLTKREQDVLMLTIEDGPFWNDVQRTNLDAREHLRAKLRHYTGIDDLQVQIERRNTSGQRDFFDCHRFCMTVTLK